MITSKRLTLLAGLMLMTLSIHSAPAIKTRHTLPKARTQTHLASASKFVSSSLPTKSQLSAQGSAVLNSYKSAAASAVISQIPLENVNVPPQVIKSALAGIAVWNEINTVKSYCNGEITRTELAVSSLTNLSLLSSTMFPSLMPYLSMAFIVIDSSKNLLQFARGNINSPELLVETIAHLGGMAVAGWAAATTVSALGSALAASETLGGLSSLVASPIGGALIGGVAFAVVYTFTSTFLRNAGMAIVNKYEAYSDPERFDRMCEAVAGKLDLPLKQLSQYNEI